MCMLSGARRKCATEQEKRVKQKGTKEMPVQEPRPSEQRKVCALLSPARENLFVVGSRKASELQRGGAALVGH